MFFSVLIIYRIYKEMFLMILFFFLNYYLKYSIP